MSSTASKPAQLQATFVDLARKGAIVNLMTDRTPLGRECVVLSFDTQLLGTAEIQTLMHDASLSWNSINPTNGGDDRVFLSCSPPDRVQNYAFWPTHPGADEMQTAVTAVLRERCRSSPGFGIGYYGNQLDTRALSRLSETYGIDHGELEGALRTIKSARTSNSPHLQLQVRQVMKNLKKYLSMIETYHEGGTSRSPEADNLEGFYISAGLYFQPAPEAAMGR